VYVKKGFELLDMNRDGMIGLEDLQNSIKQMKGKDIPVEELRAMIQEFDQDGDNQRKFQPQNPLSFS
jgi:Ca2+-binding EF-hand superfamily protein